LGVLDKRLQDLLAPLVEGLGYELWGVIRLNRRDGVLLRVYIDSTAGITLSDCERVSRQISDKLDVEEVVRGEYTLEVSSPGMDRPLFSASQYQRYIGSSIKLRLSRAIEQRRNFSGILRALENQDLVIEVDGDALRVPIDYIDKANLVA
jgi:ribosome maturation factor RimP